MANLMKSKNLLECKSLYLSLSIASLHRALLPVNLIVKFLVHAYVWECVAFYQPIIMTALGQWPGLR